MENPILISIVRTAVPIIVGFIVTLGAQAGLDIDSATMATAVTSIVSVAYYTVARELESRNAKFGRLLGSTKAPSYD